MSNEAITYINISMDKKLKKSLRQAALDLDTTVGKLAVMIIEAWLEQEDIRQGFTGEHDEKIDCKQ